MKENESITLNKQTNHHELKFLKNDLIGGFLNRETIRFVRNARLAAQKGEKRIFAQDVEKIIQGLDAYEIRGLENIPFENHSPLIIACNHPPIKDFLFGSFLISSFFPDKIHWYIGQNIPRRNVSDKKFIGPLFEKTLFKCIDSILRSIIKTYDFIGVPTTDMENAMVQRAVGLKKGIKYLRDNQIIGILPEAEFEQNGRLNDFHLGIGKMIESVQNENLQVLPTKIERNKHSHQLSVIFGFPFKPNYHSSKEEITKQIQKAIEGLSYVGG